MFYCVTPLAFVLISVINASSFCSVVYPPHSMDNEEFVWDVTDPLWDSFMASYAPVPEHLRKKKGIVDGDVVDDALDVEALVDTAGTDKVVVKDASKSLLSDDWDDDRPLAEAGRARRRLVKQSARAEEVVDADTGIEEAALNIPVSS